MLIIELNCLSVLSPNDKCKFSRAVKDLLGDKKKERTKDKSSLRMATAVVKLMSVFQMNVIIRANKSRGEIQIICFSTLFSSGLRGDTRRRWSFVASSFMTVLGEVNLDSEAAEGFMNTFVGC